jgi:hypothetical protein
MNVKEILELRELIVKFRNSFKHKLTTLERIKCLDLVMTLDSFIKEESNERGKKG